MAKTRYVVLNDGDTFTELDGCKLVEVDETQLTPEGLDALNNGNMAHFIESHPPGVEVHDLAALIRVLS